MSGLAPRSAAAKPLALQPKAGGKRGRDYGRGGDAPSAKRPDRGSSFGKRNGSKGGATSWLDSALITLVESATVLLSEVKCAMPSTISASDLAAHEARTAGNAQKRVELATKLKKKLVSADKASFEGRSLSAICQKLQSICGELAEGPGPLPTCIRGYLRAKAELSRSSLLGGQAARRDLLGLAFGGTPPGNTSRQQRATHNPHDMLRLGGNPRDAAARGKRAAAAAAAAAAADCGAWQRQALQSFLTHPCSGRPNRARLFLNHW
jgi:hypothetical protein